MRICPTNNIVTKKVIALFGPPLGGKSTHAKRVAQYLGIPHISMGKMLNAEIVKQTYIGKHAENYLKQGELVPDNIIKHLITKRLAKKDCKNGYILDGFPRTVEQAIFFDRLNKNVVLNFNAIKLNTDDNMLITKMQKRAKKSCRSDDNLDSFERRLANYNERAVELGEYYKGEMVEVNTRFFKDDTTIDILEKINIL